jgi:hypothetical protein
VYRLSVNASLVQLFTTSLAHALTPTTLCKAEQTSAQQKARIMLFFIISSRVRVNSLKLSLDVITPSKARRLLRGAIPRRVRSSRSGFLLRYFPFPGCQPAVPGNGSGRGISLGLLSALQSWYCAISRRSRLGNRGRACPISVNGW